MNWKLLNIIILSLLVIIALLGSFYKHISFGLGLGDMIGYLILYVSVLVQLILTIRAKTERRRKYLAVIFGCIIIYGCLQSTLLRGSEYKWNGKIFYEKTNIGVSY